MKWSAITDYIFPQRKLELIWLVTHMPDCQFQHSIPDTTPRWAQLAAALPAHCYRHQLPPMFLGGAECPPDRELFVALLKLWGTRTRTHISPYRCMCVYITLGRQAYTHPYMLTHAHTHALGMSQYTEMGHSVNHPGITSAYQYWGKIQLK